MADFLLDKSRHSGSQRKIEPPAAVLKDVNSAQISPLLPVVADYSSLHYRSQNINTILAGKQ